MYVVLVYDHQRFRNITAFFQVYHCIWNSGHSFHIWAFLQPCDHLSVARASYSWYLAFVDNVEDLHFHLSDYDDSSVVASADGGDNTSDREA